MGLDAVVNFALAEVSMGYNAAATDITLSVGGNPFPVAPFNFVWWNFTDYPNPDLDPFREICRCTSKASDIHFAVVLRAQEGTSASNKNIAGKVYRVQQSVTAKIIADLGLLVPAGGSAGQVLKKIDSADYNTYWATLAAVLAAYNLETTDQFLASAPASSFSNEAIDQYAISVPGSSYSNETTDQYATSAPASGYSNETTDQYATSAPTTSFTTVVT